MNHLGHRTIDQEFYRACYVKVCFHRLCNLFATGSRLEKKLKSVAKVAKRFSSSSQPVAD